jgi:shikimate kinase
VTDQGRGLPPFIAYLLGYPGVGKYTVGKALATQTGAVLIDNQVVNHPILVLFKWDGKEQLPPGTDDRAAPIRDAVFAALEEIAPRGISYVLTNNLDDVAEDIAIYERLEAIAKARGATFLPVILTCAPEIQRERVQSPERSQRLKLSDPEALERMMATTRLYSPADPNLLTIDTTNRSVNDSVEIISERLRHVSAETRGRARGRTD